MTGEEYSGPAAPKVTRLLYFAGAGFICVAAINKWRELEQKSIQRQQQQLKSNQPENSPAAALSKALDYFTSSASRSLCIGLCLKH